MDQRCLPKITQSSQMYPCCDSDTVSSGLVWLKVKLLYRAPHPDPAQSCGHVRFLRPWKLQNTHVNCRESMISSSTNSHVSVINAQTSLSLNYTDFINFLSLQVFLLHKFISCRNWWRWSPLQAKCTRQDARSLLSPLKCGRGLTDFPGFR